jgi:CubicO group peptidase (beta-lactamase class C family)
MSGSSLFVRVKMKALICGLMTLFVFSCKNQSPAQSTSSDSIAQSSNYYTSAFDANRINFLRDTMSRFLDIFLPQQRFSGGILVVKNGQTIYERYMGFTGDGRDIPVTDTTPFHVASTSKTVTSHAVLQLIAIGKLSLSDSLVKYFPAFPFPTITIRNLLNHTSGLRNYAYFFPEAKWDKKVVATNRDVLDVIINSKPSLEFIPGTRFHYSNTNFALLALLVEEISKLPFPDYVQQYIFNPAGMTHSYILGVRNQERYMPSWTGGGRRYDFEYLDAIYGDKNLYTTCRDLRAYDSAISRNLLLPQQFYDSAWQPLSADRHYRDTVEYYGLGWRLKRWGNGNKIVYHNGWWHGNNAVFQHVYQDTAVIIATGNVYNSGIYRLGRLANFFRPYYDDPNISTEAIPEGDDPGAKPADTVTVRKEKVKAKIPEKKKITTKTKQPAKKEKTTSKKQAPVKKKKR